MSYVTHVIYDTWAAQIGDHAGEGSFAEQKKSYWRYASWWLNPLRHGLHGSHELTAESARLK